MTQVHIVFLGIIIGYAVVVSLIGMWWRNFLETRRVLREANESLDRASGILKVAQRNWREALIANERATDNLNRAHTMLDAAQHLAVTTRQPGVH